MMAYDSKNLYRLTGYACPPRWCHVARRILLYDAYVLVYTNFQYKRQAYVYFHPASDPGDVTFTEGRRLQF